MNEELLARVVECVSVTTRYPKQLLTADADLEVDLGIDSVKRVEIIVVLSEEFGLKLQDESRDATIRTIGDVTNWIDDLMNRNESRNHEPVNRDHRFPPKLNGDRFTTNRISAMETVPSPPHIPATKRHTELTGNNSLEGRVALVTGSGRSVGRTIARVLAARGATIIVNSFHSREQGEQTKDEIRAQGGKAIHLWGSVANPDHVENIFGEIEQEFGHLDILVCNASDGRIGAFSELNWEDWERAFRTNVSGHHQCAIRASRLMQSRGGGSIITMSAVGAHQFIEGLGSQGVVKAAVETLTRYLACELGGLGIRTNCVVGGPVYGDLISKFPSARTTQNHWESITPDGELCSPMDLAKTIAFLVSDDARGINGAIWNVDHGFSASGDGRPLPSVSRENARGLLI